MVSELRWPGDPDPDTGIDVRSLELDASDLALMDIVRRADVMAYLAEWDAGSALGDGMRDEVLASSALAVLTVTGGASVTTPAAGRRSRRYGSLPSAKASPSGRCRRSFCMRGMLPISMSYRPPSATN